MIKIINNVKISIKICGIFNLIPKDHELIQYASDKSGY